MLAEHFGTSSQTLLGTPEGDRESLMEEGLRSLLVRGLIRVDSEGMSLSSGLLRAAQPIVAPDNAVTVSKASSGSASVGFAVVAGDQVLIQRPLMQGVHEFHTVDRERLVAFLADVMLDEDAALPEVWQLRVLTGDRAVTLSVGRSDDDELKLLSDSGEVTQEMHRSDLSVRVGEFLEAAVD